jgi:hypothetical protein
MNNWRWDNPRSCGDEGDRSNPQTTSWGKVKLTFECFSSYSSDDLRAMIEPPSCWPYKPGDFLAITPLNWDEIINEEDDYDNWRISERRAVEGAVLVMAMTMTTARVRGTRRVVRKGAGKGRVQKMRRGRRWGRQRRKGRGRGWETVNG